MEIGIFSRVWAGRELDENLCLMAGCGLLHTQFNLSSAGVESMPLEIPPALTRRVREAFARHGVRMAAVSGTFNMIHPERAAVLDGLRRLETLGSACHALGTNVITLCTGTRDAEDMWRWHPANDGPDAWNDLVDALERALKMAEAEDITLAFEPEQANVIHSARHARRLLDHFDSRHLKIVLDAANLFVTGEPAEIRRTMDEAFDLLAEDIVIAHAKDRDAAGRFVAAGQGVLDYDHYVGRLKGINFGGALVLHGLSEAEVPGCVAFLRQKLRSGAG